MAFRMKFRTLNSSTGTNISNSGGHNNVEQSSNSYMDSSISDLASRLQTETKSGYGNYTPSYTQPTTSVYTPPPVIQAVPTQPIKKEKYRHCVNLNSSVKQAVVLYPAENYVLQSVTIGYKSSEPLNLTVSDSNNVLLDQFTFPASENYIVQTKTFSAIQTKDKYPKNDTVLVVSCFHTPTETSETNGQNDPFEVVGTASYDAAVQLLLCEK